MAVKEHCVKDDDSGREFCLYVAKCDDGKQALVRLDEFVKNECKHSRLYGHRYWEQVDRLAVDNEGEQWWDLWQAELDVGGFAD